MRKPLFALIVLLLLICSCNGTTKSISTFAETDTLTLVKIFPFDSVPLKYPRMKVQDSICCVYDDGNGLCFHLYTYPGFKYMKSFGRKGHAQNELTTIVGFDFKDDKVFALGSYDGKILEFGINGDLNAPRVIRLNNIVAANISRTDDGTFIVYDTYGKHRFTEISDSGEIVNRYLEADYINKNSDQNILGIGNIGISPDGKYIVSPMQFGEVIDIMDASTKVNSRFIGELGEPEDVEKQFEELTFSAPRYNCFYDMSLTANRCYLYFRGDEPFKKEAKGEHSIRVYDYKGNPIKRYMIGDIEPSSIHADEERGFLYLTVPHDDDMIYQYKLD